LGYSPTVDETTTDEGPPHSRLTGGARTADGGEPDGDPEGAEAEPTATDETEAASGELRAVSRSADERVQAVNSRRATGAERRIGRRG
jgi:hypothetical protein